MVSSRYRWYNCFTVCRCTGFTHSLAHLSISWKVHLMKLDPMKSYKLFFYFLSQISLTHQLPHPCAWLLYLFVFSFSFSIPHHNYALSASWKTSIPETIHWTWCVRHLFTWTAHHCISTSNKRLWLSLLTECKIRRYLFSLHTWLCFAHFSCCITNTVYHLTH